MLPIVERVAAWLARSKCPYQLLATSDLARSGEGSVLQVTVVVIDGDYSLLGTPAGQPVPWQHLAERLRAARVRRASRSEIEQLFPDCDMDAIPGIGLPYGIPLYLSRTLKEMPEIVFPVGKRGTAAKTRLTTFEWLAQPCWLDTTAEPAAAD